MKLLTALGAAVLGAAMGLQAASAAETSAETDSAVAARFAAVSGKTLPPVGFVNFCARNPGDCRSAGRRNNRISMSGERWRIAYQVNNYVNGKVAPVSDQELYGESEYWTYPLNAGDCEDYVLMKKRYLEQLGFARSALLITVVLDEKNEGHAVLTLRADDGDYVLDNRHNDIRRWSELEYTYLKRQSGGDPRDWVSFGNEALTTSAMLESPEGKDN